jgi:2,4-dienoyl-CoA reductase-like NADH-dependent reductase (Old Yellow Enzyme family)
VADDVSPDLDTGVVIAGLDLSNRLYRAPLLECAGDGPEAVDRLVDELEPAAAAGVGLICQGTMPVRREGGRVAPNMTHLASSDRAEELRELTETVHDHGARIVAQLDHGGIRSLETWHRPYRAANPGLKQLAVSRPPRLLGLAARAGLLDYDLDVLSTEGVYDLAADFGRSAGHAAAAGYDGIHLAGSNMGIVQQFLSPYYNRRSDEFGGSFRNRLRFLDLVHDEIRDRVGDLPVMTKVPVETAAPPLVRPRLSLSEGVGSAEHAERIGFDALAPVVGSTFWDLSLVRGEHPEQAWNDERFAADYEAVFGGRVRARLVALANRLQATHYDFESAWNADFCRQVRETTSLPVLCEGGIRGRAEMDSLIGDACDLVGVGRPFYAEPRLPARLLDLDTNGTTPTEDPRAVCESCNNCTIPQVAGERGVCRTPAVMKETGELRQAGAYERSSSDERDE